MSHDPGSEFQHQYWHVSNNDMRLINEMAGHLLKNSVAMVSRTLQFGSEYEQTVGMTEYGVFHGQDEQFKVAVRVEVFREGDNKDEDE
jgi:hypothetical protein